jgi:hypothetical protein
LQNFAQRDLKVLLNVVAEGFERRDVENLGAILEISSESLAYQSINTSKERGERLARAGRGRD